ncbi:50S ribosomal protein L21 [Candidatus Neptunochlamydia vexilliferae]|uniref:Large ribosomal subunit protein bL21 n=1 Tax=Candidatus Neptunichlamydia vexilliferae TaxID=1651774 RepID=A0ABS0B2H4_9BACT|nr:50S ribosomal protein L21 [Candidatus Neptunochlamydia vexilliferae]MBF5059931.1 50S ribosomal protein L21 [Candidatus Neptunochlamydia vexilliferae]
MYAIIQTGGKQYRVEKGDTIEVELLGTETGPVEFKEVVLFNDGKVAHVGIPHVAKCLVKGEVIGDTKGPKVVSFKYKRRKNYRRKVGHRQKYSVVKITDIAAA